MRRILAWFLAIGAISHAATYTVAAGPGAQLAAAEMTQYLGRAYPEHRFRAGGKNSNIRLEVDTSMPAEAFEVAPDARGALLRGGSPRAVMYAAYSALERIGFGFYLSYETAPPPRKGPIDFQPWRNADRPLFADRLVFNWHNFLSSASSWELEDWQRYIAAASKLRYNGIVVHAYGNNPMFTFRHNGVEKPVGYLASTRSGRDWGTQHVNDVRRLIGGDGFRSPVFGSTAALAPENGRVEAATHLMRQAFAYARERDMGVTFALDVDTEAANPQAIVRTLPESARIRQGSFELANPDTPEGYAYYRSQTEQLLKLYPQITRLAVWFRIDRTPWRSLEPAQFPDAWKAEWEAALRAAPELQRDPHAHGMFVMSKLVRAYRRALDDVARADVELAAGSWRFGFVRAADRFFPPGVALMPLDWETLIETEQGKEQLGRPAESARKLLPILWAHHDDRTYVGPPYKPFVNLPAMMRERRASGYGIIHWTTRPLDLYFRTTAAKSWELSAGVSMQMVYDDTAARTFGEEARPGGGAYFKSWLESGRMFGRETSNAFIDVPLRDAADVLEGCARRLNLLEAFDGGPHAQYFRDFEKFTAEFFVAHSLYERAREAAGAGDYERARKAMAASRPEEAIRLYAQAARRLPITRGEEALIVSLNLRWLPYLLSMRQALGLEPARIKFGPTQHEPLAQGAGKNTFFIDSERRMWRVLGEAETRAPAFEEPSEPLGGGLRVDRPLRLKLGGIMGDKLAPGRYRVSLAAQARQGSAAVRIGDAKGEFTIPETQASAAARYEAEATVKDGFVELEIAPGREGLRLLSVEVEAIKK